MLKVAKSYKSGSQNWNDKSSLNYGPIFGQDGNSKARVRIPSQISKQNMKKNIFLWRLPPSRLLVKIRRLNKN